MEIGVSTASLFLREYNERALEILDGLDARVVEVFLNTFSEYTKAYGEKLNNYKGGLKVHSVHVVTTQYEPQLFAPNQRAYVDAMALFESVMSCAEAVGAKNYTLHGRAYFKRSHTIPDDMDRYIQRFNALCDLAEKYGVSVCLENVHWCTYNKVGFFSSLKDQCPKLRTCLDIKQARLSDQSYADYIADMGNRINTVHLSDIDELGKLCLPGKGIFDFEDLFKRLKDVGFDGNMLIEVYKDDYNDYNEFVPSLEYLRNLKEKIF